MGSNVDGLKRIQAALRKVQQRDAVRVRRALLKTGLTLQRFSQELVPIDTSALKNSARTKAEGTGFDTAVTVSYGTEYAVFVHEDLEAQHAPGKSAKFLETPLRTRQTELRQVFEDEMKR